MKCERWIDQHDTSVGKRKTLSPRQESNPGPPEQREAGLSAELRELMARSYMKLNNTQSGIESLFLLEIMQIIGGRGILHYRLTS